MSFMLLCFCVFEVEFGIDVFLGGFDWDRFVMMLGLFDVFDVFEVLVLCRVVCCFELSWICIGVGYECYVIFVNCEWFGWVWVVYGVYLVSDFLVVIVCILAFDFDFICEVVFELFICCSYLVWVVELYMFVLVCYLILICVEIDVDLFRLGVLVLVDVCYLGWCVCVDGELVDW